MCLKTDTILFRKIIQPIRVTSEPVSSEFHQSNTYRKDLG